MSENTKVDFNELLQKERKEYNRLEGLYNKEPREAKRQTLKEQLIRSDERIEIYKKFLNS